MQDSRRSTRVRSEVEVLEQTGHGLTVQSLDSRRLPGCGYANEEQEKMVGFGDLGSEMEWNGAVYLSRPGWEGEKWLGWALDAGAGCCEYGWVQGVNGKDVQIQLIAFMERNTGKFMKELWSLLLSAQKNVGGVPPQLLDAKEEETKKKAETDRITNEIQRKKEKEKQDLEQEIDKMDGDGDILRYKNAGSELNSKHDPRSSSPQSAVGKERHERNGQRGLSRLTGVIPLRIFNISSMEILAFTGNNLTELDFRNNPLNGILPVSVGNLSTSLQYLYGYNCDLRGSIPNEIGNLTSLIKLSLVGNELTESIPATVVTLQKLQGLYLQRIKISDSTPDSLCEHHNLNALSLSQNNNRRYSRVHREYYYTKASIYRYQHIDSHHTCKPVASERSSGVESIYKYFAWLSSSRNWEPEGCNFY
ncbi:unnamed protein product [Fraxinus pennsylvanica]|uniref:PWI domain-containing protein n=1 Tax=Fraxinus pennsylvanica TaxID=56036 RepID=A0AAD2A6Z0_9LAMI|nr:unnamed protein product [Fraxinus pennsylvanica]